MILLVSLSLWSSKLKLISKGHFTYTWLKDTGDRLCKQLCFLSVDLRKCDKCEMLCCVTGNTGIAQTTKRSHRILVG